MGLRSRWKGASNFGGCPARWKAFGFSTAVYAAKQIIQSSITVWQPTSMFPTGWCHITLFPLKKSNPLWCGLSSKFFDDLFKYVAFSGESALTDCFLDFFSLLFCLIYYYALCTPLTSIQKLKHESCWRLW